MPDAPISITSLIDSWPTIGEFAAEVGCGYEAARQMRRRDSIAPEHWSNVIFAAERRGIHGVSLNWLAAKRANPATSDEIRKAG